LVISLAEGQTSATVSFPLDLKDVVHVTQSENPAVFFITHTEIGNINITNNAAHTVRLNLESGRCDYTLYHSDGRQNGASHTNYSFNINIPAGNRLEISLAQGQTSVRFHVHGDYRDLLVIH
jgi:hypothetical protein